MSDICPFCQSDLAWNQEKKLYCCQAPAERDCGVGFTQEIDGRLFAATLHNQQSTAAKMACFIDVFKILR